MTERERERGSLLETYKVTNFLQMAYLLAHAVQTATKFSRNIYAHGQQTLRDLSSATHS